MDDIMGHFRILPIARFYRRIDEMDVFERIDSQVSWSLKESFWKRWDTGLWVNHFINMVKWEIRKKLLDV